MNKWEKNYAELQEIKHADLEGGQILDYFIKSLENADPHWHEVA